VGVKSLFFNIHKLNVRLLGSSTDSRFSYIFPDFRESGTPIHYHKLGVRFIMAQKGNLQPPRFANINLEVKHLEIKFKLELGQVDEVQSIPTQEYLISTDIAIHLNGGSIRGKWTSQRVNQKLAEIGYQTKPYGEWQYTDIGKKFACFDRKEGLKWHPKVIDLIIENDSPFQQLRLAV
jgi:hypothetical protein